MTLLQILALPCLAILVITATAAMYHRLLLMGYLEVCHRRLWEELGSPMLTKLFVFKFSGWILRGGYRHSGDRELVALGRTTRYLLFASYILSVVYVLGLRLLVELDGD